MTTPRPRDTTKSGIYWQQIYNIFIKYGASPDEATWAANENLDPLRAEDSKRKQIIVWLRQRQINLNQIIRITPGVSKLEISIMMDFTRRSIALDKGYTKEEAENIFLGGS